MKQVIVDRKRIHDDNLKNIIINSLSKTFQLDANQEKLQEFFLYFQQGLEESNIDLYSINYNKEVDKVLEKIENHEKLDVKDFIDKLNYVGEEGESIISFILKNSDFHLKNEVCSQKLPKQKVSNDVKITINSAMSYTEMSVKDVQELIGHVFDNDTDDFGVY